PIGGNLASADVSLGSVPLSDTVAPGGAADWTLSANSPVDGQLNITLTAKTGKGIPANTPASGGSLVTINFPISSTYNPATATAQTITVVAANGTVHTTLSGSNGAYIFKPTPPYAGSLLVNPPVSPLSQYRVTVGNPQREAGTSFVGGVQAGDASGNPITSYTGPAGVTASIRPTPAGGTFPTTVSIGSTGLGLFLAKVPQAGSYTIAVTSGSLSGSAAITVAPGAA